MKDEKGAPDAQIKPSLPLIINDKKFDWLEQYITGEQLRKIGSIPSDDRLYLRIEEPWFDELILSDTKVNLARQGIENFYSTEKLVFTVNGKSFEWAEQFITGKEIRKIAGIDADDFIYLDNERPYLDNLIEDNEKVDLARPTIEHFYTVPVGFKVTIYVNSTPFEFKGNRITYAEVVTLGFSDFPQHPERTYSVTYKKGHSNKPEGILAPGASIKVKDGMQFTVKHTGQS
jgi:hypothetical protein